jgi:hypothetical protein
MVPKLSSRALLLFLLMPTCHCYFQGQSGLGVFGENAYFPVDAWAPAQASRRVPFAPHDLEHLVALAEELGKSGSDYSLAAEDVTAVIIPSWRHHSFQFDSLRAALGSVNVQSRLAPLSDGLWARMLLWLGSSDGAKIKNSGLGGVQAKCAMDPMLARLDDMLACAQKETGGRKLLLIGTDDSAWVLRAFLMARKGGAPQVEISAAVCIDTSTHSRISQAVSDFFLPEVVERSEDKFWGSVKVYSLASSRSGSPPIVAGGKMMSCLESEDGDECILSGDESMLDTAALRLWLPKVLRGA